MKAILNIDPENENEVRLYVADDDEPVPGSAIVITQGDAKPAPTKGPLVYTTGDGGVVTIPDPNA